MRLFRFACIITLALITLNLHAQKGASDLKHWPKGSSPAEVGKKMVVKFINTPHQLH